MNNNQALVRNFSLISFLIIFSLGIGVSLGVSTLVSTKVLSFLGQVTADYAQELLHSQINIEEVEKTHHDDISRLINQGILGEKVRKIIIRDTFGNIFFPNQNYLDFPLEEGFGQALAGEITVNLNKMEKASILPVESDDRVLEIYAPMRNPEGEIVGVYELFWEANSIYKFTKEVYYLIGFMFFLGFIILYVSLYRYFKSAADTIERQNTSMKDLQKRLETSLKEKENIYLDTIKALLTALDAKDNYTAGHSVRVADLALRIGRELGLAEDRLELLEKAALFHDIGKIGIPEHILNKPGRLTPEQFAEIKKHPVIGSQIIGAISSLAECAKVLHHHHERYDGTGYPDGLVKEAIPLEARILAVSDTYDAIVSHRPYQKARPSYKALMLIRDSSGTQLDPVVVGAFLNVLDRLSPTG